MKRLLGGSGESRITQALSKPERLKLKYLVGVLLEDLLVHPADLHENDRAEIAKRGNLLYLLTEAECAEIARDGSLLPVENVPDPGAAGRLFWAGFRSEVVSSDKGFLGQLLAAIDPRPSAKKQDASLDDYDARNLLEEEPEAGAAADDATAGTTAVSGSRTAAQPVKGEPRPPRSGVRTWVYNLAEPSALGGGRPIQPTLPPELRRWVAQNKVAGGLTQATLDKTFVQRDEDYRAHVQSVEDTRELPTAPEIKEKARKALVAAEVAVGLLDRKAILANDTSALARLGQGLKSVSARKDELVVAAGGVRAAAAAFRQALILRDGNLPLNVQGLKALESLVGETELDVLKGMALFGATTLQATDPPPTVFREPYPTAGAAAGDLGYTALKDAAAGRTLLVTGASRGALAAAGAEISSLGATPKKEASGASSGKVRGITDLRPLNKFLLEHLEFQRVLSRLKAPQAACPRIQQVMRAVVVLALRYPGVDIAGGKSDLAEAFKLVHILIADVPSFSWKLPTGAIPGLEGLEVFQLLMVLPFGWDKSPGWFGLLAWVLAQAHASLGPEEPHLNGGDSFGGGVPWVDDYVFLTPLLGQRAKIAYEAYVDLATAAAGKTAVNLEKDALDGVPRIVFNPWGYIMDLSRVAAEGPAAGMLSATPEKIHKFLTQLTASEFSSIHDRKLSLKALEETTGLAVWLAQTNSLLKVLLPFFYNALNSLDSDYVKPRATRRA